MREHWRRKKDEGTRGERGRGGRCRGGGWEGVRSTGWAGGGGKVRETVGRRDEMSKGVMIGGGVMNHCR